MRVSKERREWFLSNASNRNKCIICKKHIRYLSSATKIRILNLGLCLVHKKCLGQFEAGKSEEEIENNSGAGKFD